MTTEELQARINAIAVALAAAGADRPGCSVSFGSNGGTTSSFVHVTEWKNGTCQTAFWQCDMASMDEKIANAEDFTARYVSQQQRLAEILGIPA